MQITITVHCENAAFVDDFNLEVGTILRNAAKRVAEGELVEHGDMFPLRDSNGNTVGIVVLQESEE